MTPVLSVSIQK